MKQIDQHPTDYRKRDPKSGRWLQNVDRKFCRWMSVVGGGMTMFLISTGGASMTGFIAVALMAFCTGALFTMSLKNLDW